MAAKHEQGGEQRSAKEQLQLVAQVGGVLTAYTYFLGWSFFQSALAPFHVLPEEIGISPAWLAVRAIPIGYVIALMAVIVLGLGHAASRSHEARLAIVGTFGVLVVMAIIAALAMVAYMGLSWVSEATLSRTFPGPRFSDFQLLADRRGDDAELWLALVSSLAWMAVAVGVAGLLAFDTAARDMARRGLHVAVGWARRGLDPRPDQTPPDDTSESPEPPEQPAPELPWWRALAVRPLTQIEGWTEAADPRRGPLVIALFAVVITIVGYSCAETAGAALGDYVAKGHPAASPGLLEWPAVAVRPVAEPDADPDCLIELGAANGIYLLYSPDTREVRRVSVENVVLVSSLEETCDESAT